MKSLPHKRENPSSDLLRQMPPGLLRRGVGWSQESAEVYAAVNPRPYLKHRLTPEAVLWAPQVGVAHVCHTQN